MIRTIARGTALGIAAVAASLLLVFVLFAVAGLLHFGFVHFIELLLR